jgi:hypothetical protein
MSCVNGLKKLILSNIHTTCCSINGFEKTEYPHAKEEYWTLILYYTKKSTQNVLYTYMKNLK